MGQSMLEEKYQSDEAHKKERKKQVRIEAQSIIDRLDPEHINSWPELINILENCLKNARKYLWTQNKVKKY